MNNIQFDHFPSTRYQGSKRKILPWIYDIIKELRFHTVLDACGGTASVSYLFKKMGKEVTYNDNLHFNYQIGKALIENQKYKITEEDLGNLLSIQNGVKYKDTVQRNFHNMYYKRKENVWLDTVANNIVNMNHYRPKILDYKRALCFYALFQACLIKRPFNLFHRKNLKLRTANVERNFGNKANWDTSFDLYLSQFVGEANNLVFNSKTNCAALNESIFDIDPHGYDLVYIDIPYVHREGNNESSNYMKCYHFLEGISRYDLWETLIDFSTSIRRLKEGENEKKYFQKGSVSQSVEEIIQRFRKSKIVFSYKKGGIPSIESIRKIMLKHKRNVYTASRHYQYALNKQNGNASKNREVLIIGL